MKSTEGRRLAASSAASLRMLQKRLFLKFGDYKPRGIRFYTRRASKWPYPFEASALGADEAAIESINLKMLFAFSNADSICRHAVACD